MWKDWLERTLTRSGAPVMLASEILCGEPANGNELRPALPAPDVLTRDPAEKTPEPV